MTTEMASHKDFSVVAQIVALSEMEFGVVNASQDLDEGESLGCVLPGTSRMSYSSYARSSSELDELRHQMAEREEGLDNFVVPTESQAKQIALAFAEIYKDGKIPSVDKAFEIVEGLMQKYSDRAQQ